MPFGRQFAQLVGTSPYAKHALDYAALSTWIGEHVAPCSAAVPSDAAWDSATAVEWQKRLARLSSAVPEFLAMLEAAVLQVNNVFVRESSADGSAGNLEHLRDFASANYMAVVQLVHQLDLHAGVHLGQSFLKRISQLEFYAHQLSDDKPLRLSGALAALETDAQGPHQTLSSVIWPPPASLAHHQLIISLVGQGGTNMLKAVLQWLVKADGGELLNVALSRHGHNVSLSLEAQLAPQHARLFPALLDAAQKQGATLNVKLAPGPAPKELEDGHVRMVATILNERGIKAPFLAALANELLQLEISVERITRLGSAQERLVCIDWHLAVPETVQMDNVRAQLFHLGAAYATDVALQPLSIFRRAKRLVVFDMDSTLIQQEVIDELARHAGVVDKVAAITELAMRGEIDFGESLRRRVALLRGTPASVIERVREKIVFTDGARTLCRALKRVGCKLAVISGGFLPLARFVQAELGLDYAFANQLRLSPDGETLAGEPVGPIVDAARKADLLQVLAQAENVPLCQVAAVGDGANDLPMLAAAGLGIAFNAKPLVQQQARARVNQRSLANVLYLFGYSDLDTAELLKI